MRRTIFFSLLLVAACGSKAGPKQQASSGDCHADCSALPAVTADEVGTTGVRLWQYPMTAERVKAALAAKT